MRTTIRLDDELLDQARREAAKRGTTLTALVAEGLRLALARGMTAGRRSRVALPICRAGGGPLPGVNLDSHAELLDRMEDGS